MARARHGGETPRGGRARLRAAVSRREETTQQLGTESEGGHGWDFRLLLDAVGDAIVATDESNRVTYANRAIQELLGWRPDQLVKRPLTTIIPERYRRRHLDAFERFVATDEGRLIGRSVRLPALRSDGSEIEIELTLNSFRLKNRRVLIVGSLRDVSERLVLERESTVARELLDVIAQATSFAEASSEILRAICRSLGWDASGIWVVDDQVGVMRCLDFWAAPGLDLSSFERATRGMTLSFGTGLPGRVWATGRPAWISDVLTDSNFSRAVAADESGLHAAFGFPIEAGGEVLGVVELLKREVREPEEKMLENMAAVGKRLGGFLQRKRAEEEIAFQRSLLAAGSEATLDGMLVVSERGKVTYSNQRFAEMWDLEDDVVSSASEAQVLRHMLRQVSDPEPFLALVTEVAAKPAEKKRDEVHLHDGRVFDRYTSPLEAPSGHRFGRVWYFRDITREKQAEQEVELSRQKFANMARALQQSLLPADLPEIADLDLAASYRPAGAGIDVGGDFYDMFDVGEDEWLLMVGDVAGKGPDAASRTGLLRHAARAASIRVRNPATILREVNQALRKHAMGDRFCTVACVRLRCGGDQMLLTSASAGHPLPLLVASSKAVTPLGEPGTPLGVMPELTVPQRRAALQPGDALVLYTDGVLDAGAPASELGDEGLAALLRECGSGSAADIVAAINEAVDVRDKGRPRDDVAVLVLRRRPKKWPDTQ